MKIHAGDKIKVITGKDKGKMGKVLKTYQKAERVLVEGINMVKRHVKPGAISKEGGIVSIERPIHVSNVMLVDPKGDTPVRVGYKLVEGKKYRINKKTGETI